MKFSNVAWVLVVWAMANPLVILAAGGGGMSSSSMSQSAAKKTPQERAIISYNKGIAARDKAHELEGQLASAKSERAAEKLQRKINKQYQKAAKRYRSAIKLEPRLYQAHGSLGYALKQTGDFDGAMAAYNECLKLKPEYTPAIEYRAEAYLVIGRFDEVMQAHEVLGARDKGNQKELETAIMAWLDKSERNEENSDFYDWASSLTSAEG